MTNIETERKYCQSLTERSFNRCEAFDSKHFEIQFNIKSNNDFSIILNVFDLFIAWRDSNGSNARNASHALVMDPKLSQIQRLFIDCFHLFICRLYRDSQHLCEYLYFLAFNALMV